MAIKKWMATTGATLSSLALSAVVWAQQQQPTGNLNVRINTGGGSAWYGQWYVWAGVAVFLVVVIALTNRGSRQT